MATEDAVVLAELIAAGAPLTDVLPAFMTRRFTRARYIQDQSLLICRAEMENDHSLNHPKTIGEMLHYTAAPI